MEFLDETRLFPELEYTFKHALTHELASAMALYCAMEMTLWLPQAEAALVRLGQ